MPLPLAESTHVLAPGKISLTVAAGGAPIAASCCGSTTTVVEAVGTEVRARIGVGLKQEVGVSVFGGAGTAVGHGDIPFAIGGKLSYKIAPLPWLAIVAGGGILDNGSASVAEGAGDLAVIVAPYTARNGSQFYVAARGSFAIPVLEGATDVNEALAFPIGFAWQTSKRVRLFVEAGPLFGFAQLSTSDAPGSGQSTSAIGGYGTLAVAFMF
jgi:hypothetical protein